jgi:hypothetical protein
VLSAVFLSQDLKCLVNASHMYSKEEFLFVLYDEETVFRKVSSLPQTHNIKLGN